MANKRFWIGMLVMVLVFGMTILGCYMGDNPDDENDGEDDDTPGNNTTKVNAIELTANVWSDGAVTEGGEQWFVFTATASTQYIHVIFGTMNNMDVQLYNNSSSALGNSLHLLGDTKKTLLSVSSGQVYYLKVTPGTGYSYNSSNTGTFRLTFNSVQFVPGTFDKAINLSDGVWISGNIVENGEQWFKFTATASSHYVHVSFGTMTNIDVQLYSDTAASLGNALHLRSSGNNKTELIITSGTVYYLRVMPGTDYQYQSSTYGTFQIALNTSTTAPSK